MIDSLGRVPLRDSPLDSAPEEVSVAASAARAMLAALGLPCADESTIETPRRLTEALQELMSGCQVDPKRHLRVTFPAEGEPALIAAVGIPIVSVCEHHMLPFVGHATVAYLPHTGQPIVGLSKLARIVQEYAARPQMQERIGNQVVTALNDCLQPQGAACLIRAAHTCMTIRGACAYGAEMITNHFSGAFRSDELLRAELFARAIPHP
ncbi:GTP cyclohydrolase I FolE [Streptomyces sp. SID13031]|nr:GTP cyclohydrolase I FolE [Streptomyces sp. SID13031]